ncbi:MAG: hypothetical protein JXR97_17140 [Planctomycetes bacterium]|nr:hypothetical protein [Planctomycetota bacterium]
MTCRIRNYFICLAMMLCGLASSLAAGEAQDMVTFKARDGSKKEQEGRITGDDYKGITLSVQGATIPVGRGDIVSFRYGNSDYKSFEAGLERFNSGEYESAMNAFNAASRSVSRLPEAQRALFGQHVLYYKMMCDYHMGKYEDVEKAVATLIDRIPNSAWKFQIGYYEAKAVEARDPSTALQKYNMRVTEYAELVKKERNLGWANRWIALCKVGSLRLELVKLFKSGARNEAKVKEKLEEIKAIKGTAAIWSILENSDKASIIQLEADAMEYLKEYGKLAEILNAVVRTAQQSNDRESLRILYLKRANANWNLMDKASGAEKNELAQKVMFDYFRADLTYPLGKADSALANYRIAECFLLLQKPNWKERALTHLQKAKSLGAGPGAEEAKKRIPAVEQMNDPTAAAPAAAENK